MRITDILEKTARSWPQATALVDGDHGCSWSELLERARLLGGALREHNVKPGDRVAILALNAAPVVEAFYGIPYADAVLVPINTRWSLGEMRYCIEDCEPCVLLVDDSHLSHVPALTTGSSIEHVLHFGCAPTPPEVLSHETVLVKATAIDEPTGADDDLVALFYTGGTTGRSKGVMLSHANLYVNALTALSAYQYQQGGVFLQPAPLFHLAAGSRVYNLTLAGTTLVPFAKFEAEKVLAAIETLRVSEILLIPTMLGALLNSEVLEHYDLSSLQRINYGAAPIAEPLLRRALAHWPQVKFYQGYGMTEASPIVSVLQPHAHDPDGPLRDKLGSAGQAVAQSDIRVVDGNDDDVPRGVIGELVVRGPNVMQGYWKLPELTAEVLRGGWFHTGDGAYLDADGYVFLVDRLKDMIVTGGENVYSSEVENVVAAHPAVRECAVIGVPHELWGEAVHAVVTIKGQTALDEQELIDFCKTRIAGYKCPKSVSVVENLPLSGANKVLKAELRAAYAASKT